MEENISNSTSKEKSTSLADQLSEHRNKWTEEITNLNDMMKTLPKVNELLNIIYAKRQEAVDYYYSMNVVILKQTKEYKQQALDMSNKIKLSGYKDLKVNDSQINKIVEAELSEKKSIIDLLSNHNNYMKDTIQTIDNLIYGINNKIRLGEILNGIKF